MKKRMIAISIFLVIVVALVCILPFPSKISTKFSGIRWDGGNNEYSENAEITVNGTYYQYLIKNNVFKGEISISGIGRIESCRLMDVTLFDSYDSKSKTGSLLYYSGKENSFIPAGMITVDGAFKGIVICLAESISENDRFITAPATSREAAIERATDIMGELWGFE